MSNKFSFIFLLFTQSNVFKSLEEWKHDKTIDETLKTKIGILIRRLRPLKIVFLMTFLFRRNYESKKIIQAWTESCVTIFLIVEVIYGRLKNYFDGLELLIEAFDWKSQSNLWQIYLTVILISK